MHCFPVGIAGSKLTDEKGTPRPPRPYALIRLNGLYDLVSLVNGLGPTHDHARDDYKIFKGIALGTDQSQRQFYSPAKFDADMILRRIKDGDCPKRILLDQSTEDQLVPMNQLEQMKTRLEKVTGLKLMSGNKCVGRHAAPWEQGYSKMILTNSTLRHWLIIRISDLGYNSGCAESIGIDHCCQTSRSGRTEVSPFHIT